MRRGAEISAYETRASNIPWAFSPVLDLGSDARSPRQWETFGEDPYLIAELSYSGPKGEKILEAGAFDLRVADQTKRITVTE